MAGSHLAFKVSKLCFISLFLSWINFPTKLFGLVNYRTPIVTQTEKDFPYFFAISNDVIKSAQVFWKNGQEEVKNEEAQNKYI